MAMIVIQFNEFKKKQHFCGWFVDIVQSMTLTFSATSPNEQFVPNSS